MNRPAFGGQNCSGPEYESRHCIKDKCPYKNCFHQGRLSEESLFSIEPQKNHHTLQSCQEACQKIETCKAFNSNHNSCALHKTFQAGASQNDSDFIFGPKNCPINGGWSDFTFWTTCKNGQNRGFRYCNNPKPDFEGLDCHGVNYIEEGCSDEYDGKFYC